MDELQLLARMMRRWLLRCVHRRPAGELPRFGATRHQAGRL
jgi:hypothetical protein